MTLSRRMRKCSSRCGAIRSDPVPAAADVRQYPARVLKLAQCDEQVFTTTNLKLLRQIAERVSIAIDNALAYREIQRLKERLVDENLALTEQLNNVESEFGRLSAAARR